MEGFIKNTSKLTLDRLKRTPARVLGSALLGTVSGFYVGTGTISYIESVQTMATIEKALDIGTKYPFKAGPNETALDYLCHLLRDAPEDIVEDVVYGAIKKMRAFREEAWTDRNPGRVVKNE